MAKSKKNQIIAAIEAAQILTQTGGKDLTIRRQDGQARLRFSAPHHPSQSVTFNSRGGQVAVRKAKRDMFAALKR